MKVFLIALLLVATTSAIGGDEASIKAVFDGKFQELILESPNVVS